MPAGQQQRRHRMIAIGWKGGRRYGTLLFVKTGMLVIEWTGRRRGHGRSVARHRASDAIDSFGDSA